MTSRLGTHWFVNPRRYFGNKWFRDPATGQLVSTYLYDAGPHAQLGLSQQHHIGANGGIDCAVICTNHSVFGYPSIVKRFPLVVDTRNALKGIQAPHVFRL